jgi:hypothetical protein
MGTSWRTFRFHDGTFLEPLNNYPLFSGVSWLDKRFEVINTDEYAFFTFSE